MVKGEKGIVKLQRRFAYTYNEKDHYKNVVTVPEDVIAELGWKAGQELEPKVQDGKLVFEPHAKHH
jgi:hypothetical protein